MDLHSKAAATVDGVWKSLINLWDAVSVHGDGGAGVRACDRWRTGSIVECIAGSGLDTTHCPVFHVCFPHKKGVR